MIDKTDGKGKWTGEVCVRMDGGLWWKSNPSENKI